MGIFFCTLNLIFFLNTYCTLVCNANFPLEACLKIMQNAPNSFIYLMIIIRKFWNLLGKIDNHVEANHHIHACSKNKNNKGFFVLTIYSLGQIWLYFIRKHALSRKPLLNLNSQNSAAQMVSTKNSSKDGSWFQEVTFSLFMNRMHKLNNSSGNANEVNKSSSSTCV